MNLLNSVAKRCMYCKLRFDNQLDSMRTSVPAYHECGCKPVVCVACVFANSLIHTRSGKLGNFKTLCRLCGRQNHLKNIFVKTDLKKGNRTY